MHVRIAVVCVLWVGLGVIRAEAEESVATELHRLFEDWSQWERRESPEMAMSRGDYRYADRITDSSLAAVERRHREVAGFLERLRELEPAELSETDRLNYDLFAWMLQERIDRHRFRDFLMVIGARWGVHVQIAQMHEGVRFEREEDYENYLLRLRQVPRLVDDSIELLKLGLQEGRTPPAVTLQGVPAQFAGLLEEGQLKELGSPLREMPGVRMDRREAIRERFEAEVFPVVRKAVVRLRDFVVEEYIPGCRATIAATDLPDGEAYYAFAVRTFTTTSMTARQVHEVGLHEVARLRKEMLVVIRASDFLEKFPQAGELDDDALFARFVEYLRTDPRFYHTEADDLVRGYRDICKRVDAELPRLFRTLPRLTFGVRPIADYAAPDQTTAYYHPGNIENAQSSTFYVNTYALDQRPKYEMIPLTLHESVPGHHFQSSLARERADLPEFRRHLWLQGFGEGWAVYAEGLGTEMGLYGDPYDDFGRLLYEMWRACRLVVDTGMHAFGWSRERAVAFMRENTALSEHNVTTEVDRYISWPGQATAYKIGQLKIRALRKQAERELGSRFDVRAFHDILLAEGTLPLTVLEERVVRWIKQETAKGQ